MGGSSAWKNVGRVVAGVATGGVSELVNEVSSGGIYGKKSTAAHALGLSGGGKKGGTTTTTAQTTETEDGDNVEKTEGASGTAEGGEDIYSSGAMALKKKKSTLIGSGDSTFTSTLGG